MNNYVTCITLGEFSENIDIKKKSNQGGAEGDLRLGFVIHSVFWGGWGAGRVDGHSLTYMGRIVVPTY